MITKTDNGYQVTFVCDECGSDDYSAVVQQAFADGSAQVTYVWDVNSGRIMANIVIPGMELVDDATIESELLEMLNE